MPHFNDMSNDASIRIHISPYKKTISAFIAQMQDRNQDNQVQKG